MEKPMARMPKRKVSNVPTEDQEQIKLAVWLAKQGIRFYAVPNGGRRNLLEAIKFKRMGVSPGVPDVCIPIPSGSYHGLYIELKRESGGVVSESQANWLNYLQSQGYWATVARGFEQAKAIVLEYLALTPKAA